MKIFHFLSSPSFTATVTNVPPQHSLISTTRLCEAGETLAFLGRLLTYMCVSSSLQHKCWRRPRCGDGNETDAWFNFVTETQVCETLWTSPKQGKLIHLLVAEGKSNSVYCCASLGRATLRLSHRITHVRMVIWKESSTMNLTSIMSTLRSGFHLNHDCNTSFQHENNFPIN